MNNLNEAYSYYSSIDELIKLLNKRKGKSISRSSLKKTTYWNSVIELTLVYDFILMSGIENRQHVTLTEKGIKHMEEGGFQVFDLKPKETDPKTFKEHLDDLTGLLTIFGILNAVTIFASQIEIANNSKIFDLDLTGSQFISISMYVLSLLVLWEIIWTTVNVGSGSIKFKILYFLLCMTTLGIGILFFSQYKDAIYGVGLISAFFGLIWIVLHANLKLVGVLITRRNAAWFKKHITSLTFLLLIISIIISGIIIKLIIRWLVDQ